MDNPHVVKVDQANFQQEVVQSKVPVLVDFWAPWCGPCRMVSPVLDQIADEMGGKLRIAKVNVDENQELAVAYRVSSIPSFVLFKDGQVADRALGAMPKGQFQTFLSRNL